jgi:hypothetical protein
LSKVDTLIIKREVCANFFSYLAFLVISSRSKNRRTKGLGKLDGGRPDPACSTVDQKILIGL